jgi:hypothetical protein
MNEENFDLELKKRMDVIMSELITNLDNDQIKPDFLQELYYRMGAMDILTKMLHEAPHFKTVLYRYLQNV